MLLRPNEVYLTFYKLLLVNDKQRPLWVLLLLFLLILFPLPIVKPKTKKIKIKTKIKIIKMRMKKIMTKIKKKNLFLLSIVKCGKKKKGKN